MINITEKRHSLAHLLAAAVIQLYPNAKITLGPAIDNGFYYDIDFGDDKIGDKELKNIQKAMRKLAPKWQGFTSETVTAEKARQVFDGNEYKLELVNEIAGRDEDITLYTSGEFTDLCRGGHIDDFAEIDSKSWKLDRIAGAYWRGDENNTMLTRIYGLAFDTADELDKYLKLREEAAKRDHRKIGKELDLFTFSEQIGPGLPLFTPRGTLMRELIIERIHRIQGRYGYQRVTTPHITKPDLYKTSGHWDKFGDELFKVSGMHGGEFVMKPMNCPHHTQIFDSSPKSYRDMPVRYTELGVVYRDEKAGELIGLSRVRAISQDDGHVFCRFDQIKQEVAIIIDVINEFYTDLGMLNEGEYWVSLSTRDPNAKDKYMGSDEQWEASEKILKEVAEEKNLPYKQVEGEGAFYGPKLDFQFRDALGRERQLATAQLDFNQPKSFGLEFTNDKGDKETPVMIHRAIAGSLERFMAVIIEHFAGHFPFWLSPSQIVVVPVNLEAHGEYAQKIHTELTTNGYRSEMYDSNDSLGKKIRKAKTQKIPYIIVLGDNEIESEKLTVEARNDEKIEGVTLEDLMVRFKTEN